MVVWTCPLASTLDVPRFSGPQKSASGSFDRLRAESVCEDITALLTVRAVRKHSYGGSSERGVLSAVLGHDHIDLRDETKLC